MGILVQGKYRNYGGKRLCSSIKKKKFLQWEQLIKVVTWWGKTIIVAADFNKVRRDFNYVNYVIEKF